MQPILYKSHAHFLLFLIGFGFLDSKRLVAVFEYSQGKAGLKIQNPL